VEQINELSTATRECVVSLKALTAPQYAQNLNQVCLCALEGELDIKRKTHTSRKSAMPRPFTHLFMLLHFTCIIAFPDNEVDQRKRQECRQESDTFTMPSSGQRVRNGRRRALPLSASPRARGQPLEAQLLAFLPCIHPDIHPRSGPGYFCEE